MYTLRFTLTTTEAVVAISTRAAAAMERTAVASVRTSAAAMAVRAWMAVPVRVHSEPPRLAMLVDQCRTLRTPHNTLGRGLAALHEALQANGTHAPAAREGSVVAPIRSSTAATATKAWMAVPVRVHSEPPRLAMLADRCRVLRTPHGTLRCGLAAVQEALQANVLQRHASGCCHYMRSGA